MATAGALVGETRWTTGRPIFPRDDARFRRSAPALSAEARAASASLAAAADIISSRGKGVFRLDG